MKKSESPRRQDRHAPLIASTCMQNPSFAPPIDADRLLEQLSRWQFVGPHQSVEDVLWRAIHEIGLCPTAVESTLRWLEGNASKAIGRLGRTELTQLARRLHRLEREGLPQDSIL
jgi:hypothetical protein